MKQRFADFLKIVLVGAMLAGVTTVASAVAQDSPPADAGVLQGQVTTIDGSPIRNVTVTVLPSRFPIASRTTKTVGDGSYSIAVGTTRAWLGFAPQNSTSPIRWHDGATGYFTESERLDTPTGSTTTVDFVYPGSGWMSGVVTDIDGDTVPGIEVRLDSANGPVLAYTDSIGRYRANVAEAGYQRFYFVDPSGTTGTTFVNRQMFADRGIVQAVTMNTTVTVSGTITDSAGEALAGIEVNVRNQSNGAQTSVATAADGTYSVSLSKTRASSERFRFQFRDPAGEFLTTAYVYLDLVSTDLDDIDVTMLVASTMSGQVTRLNGDPLQDVWLTLSNQTTGREYAVGTDADGQYSTSVLPGTYTIYVEGSNRFPWGYWATGGQTQNVGQALEIVVVEGDETVVDLPVNSYALIRGTVTTADGEPATDTYVDTWSSGSAEVDGEGRYEVAMTRQSGSTIVFAYGPSGYTYYGGDSQDDATQIDYALNEVIEDIDIVVPDPSVVSGTILSDAGDPVSGVNINFEGNNYYDSVQSGADGTYQIELPADSYQVWVYPDGDLYSSTRYDTDGDFDTYEQFEVGVDETITDFDFTVNRLATLAFTLDDTLPSNATSWRYDVYLESVDGSTSYNRDLELGETTILTGIASGEYIAQIDRRYYVDNFGWEYDSYYYPGFVNESAAVPFAVSADEQNEITFVFEPFTSRASVVGRIIDEATGQAIPGALMLLVKATDTSQILYYPADEFGFYRADRILSGDYFVAFGAPGYEMERYPEDSGDFPVTIPIVGPDDVVVNVELDAIREDKYCHGHLVTVDLSLGDVPTDQADVILGTDGTDWINAGGGNDVVCAEGGIDLVSGGDGDDTLYGGDAPDLIGGGNGNDTIYGEGAGDILGGNAGTDRIYGGDGDDNLAGHAGSDSIWGDVGNDVIDGGSWGDTLNGGAGNDVIEGRSGRDILVGGSGGDTLNGGLGDDVLRGSAGNDSLAGAQGADALFGDSGTDSCDGGGQAADTIAGCEN